MNFLQAVADVLLPRICIVCERRLNVSEEHICLHCRTDMPLTYFWDRDHNEMADKYNRLIESGSEFNLIGGRLERYAYAMALFFYDGSGHYRKITQQLKYHANLSLGRDFGKMLGLKIRCARHLADVDVVIPVPLHWMRRWERGYNQAEVIAAEVAKVLDVDLRTDVLRRCKRTRTQTKVDPKKKFENVRGAFVARRSYIQNDGYRHVLIVDDVFTSGATLHNCFLALRAVLPVSVRISVATLAYVGGA